MSNIKIKENESKSRPQLNEWSSTNVCITRTPVHKRHSDNDDESPLPYTQELSEDIDVVWDWNSPQDKKRFKRSQRRLHLTSPKTSIRRHPSNHQIQNFEKLREELRALRNEIAVPENEDSLIISPLEEQEFKNESPNKSVIDELKLKHKQEIARDEDLEDLFNDSADEQLVMFSQRIECVLEEQKHCKTDSKTAQQCSKIQNPGPSSSINKLPDDSFDIIMSQIGDDDIEATQIIQHKPLVNKSDNTFGNKNNSNNFNQIFLDRAKSHSSVDAQISDDDIDATQILDFKPAVSKMENTVSNRNNYNYNQTHSSVSCRDVMTRTKSHNSIEDPRFTKQIQRTQSLEISNQRSASVSKDMLELIERKRKEALSKLEAKKKHDSSQSKCSAEEIEKKRLEALAKLAAKKQQEAIERNRKEALKKLEMKSKHKMPFKKI